MDRLPLRKIVESGTCTFTSEFVNTVRKDKFKTTTWKRVMVIERRVLRLECGHTASYAVHRKKKRVGCYHCARGRADGILELPITWDGEIK